ncbi:hypothetical protein Cgig2_002616 [Carnegiea gigantea]|uniref:Nop domain-containing protein n=1 Tax=Carnegiea gigantea TaxID=171969 RepID=A0A9Q1QAF4_9CARY|nr:hypothetical protein Cgig2_002616 [Carnegiea gigantea]
MGTLSDSFTADPEDLELSGDEFQHLEDDDSHGQGDSRDDDCGLDDLDYLKCDNVGDISKLQESDWYRDIMKKIDSALQNRSGIPGNGMVLNDDDPEYKLIAECNSLLAEIDNEIAVVHSFICDKYRLKFPELESLIQHPIDYAKVVQPLPENTLQKTIEACDQALSLDSSKRKVLEFVESRMLNFAPNLSAIVGISVASKLIGCAGGLSANMKCLGSKRKNLAGFSSATHQSHVGFLKQSEIYQSTPPPLRDNVCRFLFAKSCLAARLDALRSDPTGGTGRALREYIHKKIEHLQQHPHAALPKTLPVPDSRRKKRRGGRWLRKMKLRYAITDMRRLANMMFFGITEESSLGDGLGEGYGMLGKAGSEKPQLSIDRGANKLAAKVTTRFKAKRYKSNGITTSGLTSNLTFTPVQGIELANPLADIHQHGGLSSAYFSEAGIFSKINQH